MRYVTVMIWWLSVVLCMACSSQYNGDKGAIDKTKKAKGDKMEYGLACDGSNDSILVFLPNSGGDPVIYNIVKASKGKKIFGHPETGDWVGIMINPNNQREATMVVDLDQLKGTWTYQVLPTIRESKTKSRQQIEAELTDSMRAILFVPREYGFSLKRHFSASSVGFVYKGNSLEDESLVEYPPVPRYTSWRPYNGKLIITRDTLDAQRQRIPDNKVIRDTLDFVFMMDDSLALRVDDTVIGFHRQKSVIEANRKANEAAQKQASPQPSSHI